MHASRRYQSIEVVVEIEKSTTLRTDTQKRHHSPKGRGGAHWIIFLVMILLDGNYVG